MSNWYQNLDDKMVRECVRFNISILDLSCSKKNLFKKTQIDKNCMDIKKKYKKDYRS